MKRTFSALAAAAVAVAVATASASAAPAFRATADSTPAPRSRDSAPITVPGPAGLPLLRVLVTDDDGVGADGIDAIVEALRKLENVEVTVIAPATNQSGTGNNTSPDPSALMVLDATTKSGYPAKAVVGFPADTIVYAIDGGGYEGRPDLVVSGINEGQNLSFLAEQVSGTAGAARAAAARGLMAIAASQGAGEFDYPAGVEQVIAFINEHRAEFGPGEAGTPMPFVNINVPSCAEGTEIRGVALVPLGLDPKDRPLLSPSDCASTLTDPVDDVDAYNNGFVAITEMPAPPAAPTTTG